MEYLITILTIIMSITFGVYLYAMFMILYKRSGSYKVIYPIIVTLVLFLTASILEIYQHNAHKVLYFQSTVFALLFFTRFYNMLYTKEILLSVIIVCSSLSIFDLPFEHILIPYVLLLLFYTFIFFYKSKLYKYVYGPIFLLVSLYNISIIFTAQYPAYLYISKFLNIITMFSIIIGLNYIVYRNSKK